MRLHPSYSGLPVLALLFAVACGREQARGPCPTPVPVKVVVTSSPSAPPSRSREQEAPIGVAEPLHVGGEVQEPIELSRVPIDFKRVPNATLGIGIYEAVISASGSVEKVHVFRSHSPAVDREALRVIKLWRYKPATFRGETVPVYLTISINLCG